MSPKKKKLKKSDEIKSQKRTNEEYSNPKRLKPDHCETETMQALKRKNFIKACEQVSCAEYLNYAKRFKLVYLPSCVNRNNCKHESKDLEIYQMPMYAEESFNIEVKTNMWCEALEVCFLSLTPSQYLSSNVLKNVVEIIMNAHEDPDSDYTVSYLIEKCQQILSQNFSTHPPCLTKTIRKCYNNFLTSPMDLKENTFTNRTQYGCEEGIVKYCMNRLEYEISIESKDEPFVSKFENIPEEMRQSVKGLHWQKEKFEIFEALHRNERIKRLMKVLESVIELLQFDLAIWHSRHGYNLGSQLMRSQRPLMAFLLWSTNVLYTGTVNKVCRQILKIFAYLVHLDYPEEYIRIMTIWLNSIVQTFYMCENNSNSDYPNTGKYCTSFAGQFHNIIKVLPEESIIKVLKRIQPTFMQYLLGYLHVKSIMWTNENDIIVIINNLVKKKKWEKHCMNASENIVLNADNRYNKRKIKSISSYLSKIINKAQKRSDFASKNQDCHPKYDNENGSNYVDKSHIIATLYITFTAYLDAFNVQQVQNALDTLNEKLLTEDYSEADNCRTEYCTYSATEGFIKKYRSIYQMLKELMLTFQELKSKGPLPEVFKIFENASLLSL